MEEILLPSKIELTPGKSDREATLTIEPCFQGYGTTLGNALRRVMLSSLPGAAVTAVKIKGAQHEFSAIPGVKEDVLEIVLNLKGLRLRVFSEETVRLSLKSSGDKNITAADIEKTQDVEIMNPDLHIATMTDKSADFEMEIFISKGRGFVTTEERTKEKQELGVIAIDSIFTPVREVGYKVENVRVGEITNYDQLVMTIETDGTITPDEAIDQTVKILLDHFSLILHRNGAAPVEAPVLEAVPSVAVVEAAPVEEEAVAAPAAEEATEEGETKKKAKKASKKKK